MKPRVAPEQLENPDFETLKNVCKKYMDEVAKGDYVDEDFTEYIFEEAINALYEENIWDFINDEDDED